MKVSIALCTFNGEKFLPKQLESFQQQTQLPNEIIICDDGSNDSTISILEDFKSKSKLSINIYQNKPGLGVISNFEKAISLCSGDVIFLSDQDDIWESDKIKTIIDFFETHPEALMVFTNGKLIDQFGNDLDSSLWEKWGFTSKVREEWLDNRLAFNYLIRNDNKITGATAAIKRELKKDIFPFKVPVGFWHDAWLGLFASYHKGLFFIEKSLIKYRVHQNQLVGIGNGTSLRSASVLKKVFRIFVK